MKRLLKIVGAVIGILAIVLLVLYAYVINNAEDLIKSFINKQSNGKLAVDIKKIKFDLQKLHLTVIQPHFYSTDTLTQPTTYDIKATSLVIQLTALKPLIFERKIYLDTIACMRPQITSTKWKEQESKGNFSLPEQMGIVYSKLNGVMNTLNIKYCLIDSGSFTLVNKVQKNSKPVSITDYYLRIDNFKKKDSSSGNDPRYLYSDRIKFYSSHQDIVFPDGYHGIKYSRLRINSFKHSIEIDSCFIYGKKGGSGYNEFGVFFDTLRLTNADFDKLTRLSLIKADTALCINPEVRAKIELGEKQKRGKSKRIALSKDSIELAVKSLLGDIDIKYVGVSNAYLSLQTKSNDKITDYTTRKSNFIMQDIVIMKDPAVPLQIGSFFLGLQQYKAHNADSTYSMSFDSILFRNNKINLSNFAITPTGKNRNFTDRKEIRMASLEIRKISWLELIMNKKIVAGEVTLLNPEISIIAPEKKQTSKVAHRSLFSTLHGFDDKVTIDQLEIQNANINFYSSNKNHLRLEKVNTVISLDELLQSGNINDLAGSVNIISFAGGGYNTGASSMQLQNGVINGKDKTIFVSAASISAKGGKSTAHLKDIRIKDFRQVQNNLFDIGSLSWQKADIVIFPTAKKINASVNNASTKKDFQLVLTKLDAKNTTITIQSDSMYSKVNIDWLRTSGIDWDGKNKPGINNLQIKGSKLLFKKNALDLTILEFMIDDQKTSFFNQVAMLSTGKRDSIFLQIPNLTFKPDIASIIAGDTKISDIELLNPAIRIITTGDTVGAITKQKGRKLPLLFINKIHILNPVVTNLPDIPGSKINLQEQKSDWTLTGIQSNGKILTIDGFIATASGFSAETKNVAVSLRDKGNLQLGVKEINFSPATDSSVATWSANVKSLSIKNAELATKKNDSLRSKINFYSFDLENLALKSGEKLSARSILAKGGDFHFSNVNMSMISAKNDLRVNGLAYDHQLRTISLDSMAFRPVLNRDSFNIVYRKDFMDFKTGKTTISGLDPELYLNDSIFSIKKIAINQPSLQIYKDKRLPSTGSSSYKALPTGMLQGVTKKIKVDSLQLILAAIQYEEINDKTGMLGNVRFENTQALVQGIKTFDFRPTDSLRLYVESRFMDSAFLRLRFNESYQDSLHGFLIGVRLGSFNMTALNPILEPLVSAKINRGWMDTLRMNAIGREYLAHGKMRMYYRNLNASYLNKGSVETKTFKTRLFTFVANSVLLHKNNQRGYGQVYAERKREKGIFNYWIKMVTSGAISSTGVKSNKKQQKKYSKSVKRLKVPEIPEIQL